MVDRGHYEERRKPTAHEEALCGASEAEVLKAYADGLISVPGVSYLLGLSDRRARTLLRKSQIPVRSPAEETAARMRRSSGLKTQVYAAPADDVVEQLYRDHLQGKITQVDAAKRLGIRQQNFGVRYLRWRVKQLETENAGLKKQLQQPTPAPTENTRPRRKPNFSLMFM